jgi:hypothetical protein
MRGLNRNKRFIGYALRTGEVPNVDEYGNETGESTPTYSPAVGMWCNVSAASGEDAVQAFGSFTEYTRTIFVADPNCPIDENTIVWFGTHGLLGEILLGKTVLDRQHNYIVVRKADSKNGVLYALQEVTVT